MFKLNLKNGTLLFFSGRFLSSNIYLIVIDGKAVAVDCGMLWTTRRVLDYLDQNRLKLEFIFLTHSHFDHVIGMNRLKRTETRVVAHTRSNRGDVKVKDGDIINAIDNQLSFLVVYTGVHRADHVWYYEKNNALLFIGNHLPDPEELRTLKERHVVKPKVVLPGHGKPGLSKMTSSETFS